MKDWIKNWYICDVDGNVMANYEQSFEDNAGVFKEKLKVTDHAIYGSERLGNYVKDEMLGIISYSITGYNTSTGLPQVNGALTQQTFTLSTSNFSFVSGNKNYELSNHLSNVLAVVQDRKLPIDDVVYSSPGVIDYYLPVYNSFGMYYAFGASISEKGYLRNSSQAYKFGFNGQEKEGEIGEYYSFEYRIQDTRLGRFLCVDPLSAEYPWYTPYQFAGNTPIWAIDLEGLEPKILNREEGSEPNSIHYNLDDGSHLDLNIKGGDEIELNKEGKLIGFKKNNSEFRWNVEIQEYWKLTVFEGGRIGKETNHKIITERALFFVGLGGNLFDFKGALNSEILYSIGYRLGTNGNYKLTPRLLNMFKNRPMTEATKPISNFGKAGKITGGVALIFGFVLDGYGTYKFITDPESDWSVHPAKAATNTGVTVLGIGWKRIGLKGNLAAALLYSSIDNFYPGGWFGDEKNLKKKPGALRVIGDVTQHNREIIPDWKPFPKEF